MIKYVAPIAMVVILALAVPGRPVAPSGSWNVDSRTSDVQLSTDGTTDFGKKKTNFTVGFARVAGTVKLDSDPANSSIHIDFYPSTSTTPTIDHDGKVNSDWFANRANDMMVCFHSQSIQPTPDGHLKATGTMGLIREDRNVELTANEAYSGPVYGPPILNHVQSQATFVFNVSAPDSTSQKKDRVRMSGSTTMAREDFPALLRAVISTPWPTLVREQHCTTTGVGEAYAGAECTGSFLAPSFPLGPNATAGEDYPGPQNFNTIAGGHLSIAVHLRLTQADSGAKASGGN
jgi:polyisoprenoid-binding protein YceI